MLTVHTYTGLQHKSYFIFYTAATYIKCPMASFSSDLLAIVSALTYSTPQALSSTHRQSILANADALDAILKRADGASLTDRAAMACKASQILFGDRAVTPQEPSYMEEQQENWLAAYFSALG